MMHTDFYPFLRIFKAKRNKSSSYAKYYVRKTGNDTTGDGSSAKPWLTINKAKNTIPIGGKCIVYIGDGTYVEGTKFVINRLFQDWVIFTPENGTVGNVKITGTSTFGLLTISASSYTRLEYITIGDNGADLDVGAALIETNIAAGASVSNLYFYHCTFTGRPAASSFTYGMYIYNAGGTRSIQHFTLDSCTFNQTSDGNDIIFPLKFNTGTAMIDDVKILNCVFNVRTGTYQAIQLINVTNSEIRSCVSTTTGMCGIHILGGTFSIFGGTFTGANYGMLIGEDGLSVYTTLGTVKGAKAIATSNHGICVGGCTGVQILDCDVHGGDNGIVIKEAVNIIVNGGEVTSVAGNAVLCKAAINPHITNVTITISAASGLGVEVGVPSGTKCSNVTFTNNTIICSGTAAVFNWITAGDDGGGVVDYNTYTPDGTRKYGQVLADADVQTFTELRTAWAGYGDGSNDSHSIES